MLNVVQMTLSLVNFEIHCYFFFFFYPWTFKNHFNCYLECCHSRDDESDSIEPEISSHEYVLLTPGGKYVPLVRTRDDPEDRTFQLADCCLDNAHGQNACNKTGLLKEYHLTSSMLFSSFFFSKFTNCVKN